MCLKAVQPRSSRFILIYPSPFCVDAHASSSMPQGCLSSLPELWLDQQIVLHVIALPHVPLV